MSTKVSVSAKDTWVNTGVDLKAGEALTIDAKGEWTFGGENPQLVDADGHAGVKYQKATLNSANLAALIGKVGDQVFPVGKKFEGKSLGTGRLYLQINDDPNALGDNSGTLDVEVRQGVDTIDSNFYYRLSTKWQGPGRSLDIVNDGSNNNRPILANTGDFTGQMWRFTPVGDGYYRLTTRWQGDAKSLDVINDGKDNNRLILAGTANVTGQMWMLQKTNIPVVK